MFIGHFGVALAAKKGTPKTSLAVLVIAAQWLDLIWPILLLLGIERVEIDPGSTAVTPLDFVQYPISHSLLAVLGWATLLAGIYKLLRPRSEGASWIWALVMSHWLLDAATHRPDLPLYPGSTTLVGLGLWNSMAGTVLVEGILFVFGVALYAQATVPKDRLGTYSFRAFVAFLVLLYLTNVFGSAPPNARAVAVLGVAQWLLVLWAYWVDRHRMPTPAEARAAEAG